MSIIIGSKRYVNYYITSGKAPHVNAFSEYRTDVLDICFHDADNVNRIFTYVAN